MIKLTNNMPHTIYMTQNPEQLLEEAFSLEPGEEMETELSPERFYIGSYQSGEWVLARTYLDIQNLAMTPIGRRSRA